MNEASLRIDKWLWRARFFKTRSLAARRCASGGMRVSGTLIRKAHCPVKVGDVLTFSLGPHIRVIKVLALGARRGPASEARTLYEDLSPPQRAGGTRNGAVSPRAPASVRGRGAGRPTKADRRAIMRLKDAD